MYAFSVDAFATERSDLGASGEFNAEETFRRTVSTSTVCDCVKRIPEISEVGALVSSRTHVLAFCTKGRSANAFSREDRNVSTSIPPGPAGSGPSGFLPPPMSKSPAQHYTKTSYEYALPGRSSSAKRRLKVGNSIPHFSSRRSVVSCRRQSSAPGPPKGPYSPVTHACACSRTSSKASCRRSASRSTRSEA